MIAPRPPVRYGQSRLGLTVTFAVAIVAAQAPTTFRTGASFIRVDVFPTAHGTPVTDLKESDFTIVEDKIPQKIASFEHVVVRAPLVDEPQREPGSRTEERDMLQNGRSRVFVLFLDSYHVEQAASLHIRRNGPQAARSTSCCSMTRGRPLPPSACR